MRIGYPVVVGRLGRPTFTRVWGRPGDGLFSCSLGLSVRTHGEDDDHEYGARAAAFG